MSIETAQLTFLLASAFQGSLKAPTALETVTIPQGTPSGAPAVANQVDEGEALTKEFGVKAQDWYDRRLALSRGGKAPDLKVLGPHPALEYKSRFEPLVKQGSGWAQVWWIDNLDHLHTEHDTAGKRAAFLENYDRLLSANASRDYMMFVLGNVKSQRELLGVETVDEMLTRLVAASSNPEVKARAAQMHAAFHQPADPMADPARFEEALELHRSVVATWPETLAARDSAGTLLPGVQREFESAMSAWFAAIVALEKQGASIEDWPAAPFETVHPMFQTLARSGLPGAVRWINRVYNRQIAAEAQGKIHALTHVAMLLGPSYPITGASFAETRMGIVELTTRAFPEHPSVVTLLEALIPSSSDVPIELLERSLAPCLTGKAPYAKGVALHLMAQRHLQAGSWTSAVEGLRWCERMERECADHSMLSMTVRSFEQVRKILPGQPAPDFAIADVEKRAFKLSDYRGRVVLLVFYSQFVNRGFDDVPLWREFQSRNRERPVSVVGINSGAATSDGFTSLSAQLGISWRTGMLPMASGGPLHDYRVFQFPGVVVIDAEGVIRGRDLPWAETKALLEQWIQKAEQKKQ